MSETDDAAELLFFDTFSHEDINDINLDLVQFPKPVYITQVRIIPLGARVQADFPGGVRLGATNPSKFDIEFFVNDLGMPGASVFENLGHLRYNQNDCIHLECTRDKIPTDGLVLRGWYSTITLAVYGILTNSMNEPIASPTLPCEPAGPEDLCNLSSDGRSVMQQEDVIKDEWKDALPSDLMTHKANASDYELDEMDYNLPRDHYHSHGDDEPHDVRRLRRSSRSSELSPNALQHQRTHSESNERDYVRTREKSTRDWSRSPDYSSRRARHKRSDRSRSDAEETHKWPRTPPASIDSPIRPRSPDTIDFNDDDDDTTHYKLKTHGYMHSSDSLGIVVPADEESCSTPNEQFEPILSDDEIMGDDDDDVDSLERAAAAEEFELEIDAAAMAAPPAIDAFDPWKLPLLKYEGDLHVHYSKELENLRLLFKKFSLQTKCENLEAYKDACVSIAEREQFVYLSEQLNNQLTYLSLQYKRRNFVLQQFFKSDSFHLQQAASILQIALDFDAACMQPQPAFKIRHIKVGTRLAELICSNSEFFVYLVNAKIFEPFEALFKLYNEKFMALSIKLMILKAVYALLDTKAGISHFLGSKLHGYQLILETLKATKLTRTKFALQAIIKKLNLYEALEAIRENCTQLFVLSNYYASGQIPLAPYQIIEHAFEQLMEALYSNSLSYQQPRRYLPVSKKFEIVSDAAAQRSFANALQTYFKQHSLAESLLLVLSNATDLPATLLLCALDVMQALLQSHVGINYFVDDAFETTQLLVAVLLGIDDVPMQKQDDTERVNIGKVGSTEKLDKKSIDVVVENLNKMCPSQKSVVSPIENSRTLLSNRLIRLGLELAYKVQTRYHFDAIVFTATSNDYDAIKLATHLHALYSQTCNPVGRQCTVELIGINNHLQIFLDLIKKEQRLQTQRQLTSPGAKYKSPVLSYAVDMLDCCVRYCEQLDYLIEHGAFILDLAKNHDTFEPSVSAVLQEMYVYLKPLEAINIFAYDDITPLVEVITRSLEYITTFPGDLIMGLRILRYLAICKSSSLSGPHKTTNTEELKHRFVALQFYAADGVQILMQIIEKLCTYFEQPGLHSPALMTIQGVHCCQIILPTLQILRELLSYAIQCRDVNFRDLTAVDYLVKAYCLLHYYPTRSQAVNDVELAKQEIIQTLLAYTQPYEQDEEKLHKSLWTQMVRELLKSIDGPATFVPGVQILSELLPLPLPVPLPENGHLSKLQAQRLVTERNFWSAHLHPQSLQISKLIETIALTSFLQLSHILTRVCLQLGDLAPNMTLLISRTLTDLICNEWTAKAMPTPQLARFLHFFARLAAYAPLKSSALSILSGKLWELLQAILALRDADELCLKCQLFVHRILESFLDSEISLISPYSDASQSLNLAAALPPKELIPRIVDSILASMLSVDERHSVSALSVRNLVILTEHDITFYHLLVFLRPKLAEFQAWMLKVIAVNESGPDFSTNIISLLILLRALTHIQQTRHNIFPPRTMKLTANELAFLICYQKNGSDKPNLVQRIEKILIKYNQLTDDEVINDMKMMKKLMTTIDLSAPLINNPLIELEDDSSIFAIEPFLPQAESIVTQYDARPVYVQLNSMPEECRLTAHYWLEPLELELIENFDAQYERIPCDLNEIASIFLQPDTNLSSDCKRVLHLSASPQSNRERTPTAPCFRTRRVEVEPSTGRPEKKLYITPVRGRGYSRPPPTRGDLFRSRPPNTSRPPSLHVDDFLALETCGAQPTGPTGYNKIPSLLRGSRVGRNRGSRIAAAAAFRQKKMLRTSSPAPWGDSPSALYRGGNPDVHFVGGDVHYGPPIPHFNTRPRGRGLRMRPYLR